LGTVARFFVAGVISGERYPWGITLVNLSGALLFGLLWGALEVNNLSKGWNVALLTGFLGAYTTFSTWVFEIVIAAQQGRLATSLLHLLVHVGFGVGLMWLGMSLGRRLELGLS
jgi:CrcB protein